MRKILPIILLFLLFGLAIFLRVYFCYDKVFSDPIKYAADDGVYHMRLVENELLGKGFPHRIYFDAYTYFPNGTYVYFTPLYDQLLAGVIWLITLGKPTLELINKIAPFYPAVLGSLMVFLVYFAAKAIWGKRVGFLSAFLIALSPPFLYKSLVGVTDHHVAEVLFSTLTMMFLIFALRGLKIETVKNRKFWFFAFLTGLSLGLYFLIWSGALLFLFIIFVFITLYYLVEYLSKRSLSDSRVQNRILLLGVIIFSIALLMIAPFFGHPDLFNANMYNIQHLVALILGIFGFVVLGGIANFIRKKGINRWFLPVFFVFTAILLIVILKLIFPLFFGVLMKSFQAVQTGVVPHKLARELISEMRPLGFQGAINIFSSLFFISLLALAVILYRFIKKRKPEELLIFVWTSIIILMAGVIPFLGQGRFAYYLSCNISLLSGFLIVRGFEFGWRGLKTAQKVPLTSSNQPYFLVGSLLIIFNVVFLLLFPFPFNIGNSYPKNLPAIFQTAIEGAKTGPFIEEDDWYDTLKWLRENTPDPGVDYYASYQEPGVDKETGEVNPYIYPKEAYGVLANWSVGHMITYYAHRIPSSNPFQQGIGRKENGEAEELGEAVFFLETDEQKAVEYLDELKTKYVITDYLSAHPKGIFSIRVKWAQEDFEGYYLENQEPDTAPNKFDNSMVVRLHVLDGREETTEREVGGKTLNFYIKPLDHFRLVYESKRKVIFTSDNSQDDIKAIKIFEYVKGARIIGQAGAGDKVTLSTEVETNRGRKFVYQKTAKEEDGYFEFVVPYSTLGEKGRLIGQTQFVVFAQPYKLKIGDKEIEINISEEDILEGKTIKVK